MHDMESKSDYFKEVRMYFFPRRFFACEQNRKRTWMPFGFFSYFGAFLDKQVSACVPSGHIKPLVSQVYVFFQVKTFRLRWCVMWARNDVRFWLMTLLFYASRLSQITSKAIKQWVRCTGKGRKIDRVNWLEHVFAKKKSTIYDHETTQMLSDRVQIRGEKHVPAFPNIMPVF